MPCLMYVVCYNFAGILECLQTYGMFFYKTYAQIQCGLKVKSLINFRKNIFTYWQKRAYHNKCTLYQARQTYKFFKPPCILRQYGI